MVKVNFSYIPTTKIPGLIVNGRKQKHHYYNKPARSECGHTLVFLE